MAKERKVHHVTPSASGGWDVKGDRGGLKVHKQDGTFQTEYTYEADPHPPKCRPQKKVAPPGCSKAELL